MFANPELHPSHSIRTDDCEGANVVPGRRADFAPQVSSAALPDGVHVPVAPREMTAATRANRAMPVPRRIAASTGTAPRRRRSSYV